MPATDQTDDRALLRQFATENSGDAFATLVARHIGLVHSAARRQTGDPHAAEEITQAVFIILARKAGSLGGKVVLPGWLYQTARLTAANYLRTEIRRVRREQEAHMNSLENETPADTETWQQIAPLLDTAMGGLNEADRNAIVLRFFENKSMGEIAAALDAPEATVRKRVTRAVKRLRKFFKQRGITLTAAAIAGAVSANSVQAVPVGLAATVAAMAVKGTLISATITTLVKGTLKLMTYAKLKLALGITVGILLAGGATTMVISQTTGGDKLTPQEIAKQSRDAYDALASYSDNGTIISETFFTDGSSEKSRTAFNIRLQRPKSYRADWQSTGGLYAAAGVIWSEGKGDFIVSGPVERAKTDQPEKCNDMQQAFAFALSDTTSILATFYEQNTGDVLGVPALGRSRLKRESDEKIGGVDCYAFFSEIDAADLGKFGTTFWIGKRDHLIHQLQTVTEGVSVEMPRQSDDSVKGILERQSKPSTPEAIAAWRTQMDEMMKKAKGAKYVRIETHENIGVSKKFSPTDFAR